MPVRTPFVGREVELKALEATIASCLHDGSQKVAVVTGDPGSGKTRLLSEASGDVRDLRLIRLQGSALEQHIQLAGAGPLLDAITRFEKEGDGLRELRAAPFVSDQAVAPVRLFEATLNGLPGIVPALLTIDDFHWMDETSVALIHYLVRSAVDLPLAVIVATRPSPVASALVASFGRLLSAENLRVMTLDPLDRTTGVSLIKRLKRELSDEDAERIWQRSQGNPFWIEQLIGHGAGVGSVVGEVSTLLTESLGAISGDEWRILTHIALAERALTVEDVVDLVGWPPRRIEKAVRQLADSGLVVEAAGGTRVAHDLIRQGIVEMLSPDQRRAAHKNLAAWLEAQPEGNAVLALTALEHRLAGGLPVEEAALSLSLSAGSRSLGQSGINRIVAIAADSALSNPQLATALAGRAVEVGDHRRAFELWSHLASFSSEPNAEAALAASEAAFILGFESEAWHFLGEAQRLAGSEPVLLVEVQAQHSILCRWLSRQVDEAVELADRALAGGVRLGNSTRERRARLKATLAAADAALMASNSSRMLELADELTRLGASSDESAYVRGLSEGALAMRLLGKNREAELRARRAWTEARQRVLPQQIIEVGPLLARILVSLGRLSEAQEVVDHYMAVGDRLAEYRPARAFHVVIPAMLKAARGEWRGAVDLLEVVVTEETEPHYRLQAEMEIAALLASYDPARSITTVEAMLTRTLTDADLAGCRRCQLEVRARGAEALARIGLIDRANELLGEVGAIDQSEEQLRWCRMTAEAALQVDKAAAATAWEAAGAEAERQGLHYEAIRNRVDHVRALVEVDRTRASSVAREIGEAATAMGATTERRAAEQILRGLGVRTWKRGAGAEERDLTDRERQIAAMIEAGATNPQIAEQMFLSRKTVERHVSNILAKLGVRNRAELAGVLRSHQPQ